MSEKGKTAITEILDRIDISNELSLFEIKLHTGRTHQIRIHLASSGCGIAGDPWYGNNKNLYRFTEQKTKGHLFLHSWKLKLDTASGFRDFSAPLPAYWSTIPLPEKFIVK